MNISWVVGRTTFPGFGVVLIESGFVRSEINSTGAASPDAVGGAYRHFTEAIRRYAVDQFEGGADPRELAELLVDGVESRRPRTRYLFPTSSRLLVGTFAGVPDRLADALKLRAAGVRR